MSTEFSLTRLIKQKSIKFAKSLGVRIQKICNKSSNGDSKASNPDIFDDISLFRSISCDSPLNNDKNDALNYGRMLSVRSPKSVVNEKNSDILVDAVRLDGMLEQHALSQVFSYLDKKEIAIFTCVSKKTKCIYNKHCLRFCKWMVNKRAGLYVLKSIDNIGDVCSNINIDTLTWSDKYNGSENWDILNNTTNNDDIWYLVNEYWFGNDNFSWGTFEKSSSKRKKNGEWRVLNNPDINDRAFYLDNDELNGILAMLRHPLLINKFVTQANADDSKINSQNGNKSNNKLLKPIDIVFDKRKNISSKMGRDMEYFDEKDNIDAQSDLLRYKVTYWNNADSFETTGIKISGNKIHKNKSKRSNIIWVNKEILYCNFLTNMYYNNRLCWEWYNNDTCKYIQYSKNNIHLINQLECNYQSNKLNVFTSQDRSIINITSLNELKKYLKQNIDAIQSKNAFENTKYFKFRCFDSDSGQLCMSQVSLTKQMKNCWSDYDRQIKRIFK